MNKAFSTATLQHIATRPAGGDAAHRVISAEDFADAWAELPNGKAMPRRR